MPQIMAFQAAKLPDAVQVNEEGKKRKPLAGGSAPSDNRIDLRRDCELLSMLQHSCEVARPNEPGSVVTCWPVRRLFRRCQDRKGPFMVETTAWEGFEGCPADNPKGLVHAVDNKQPVAGKSSAWHKAYWS
ncbi:hypothetical protein PspLS_11144 [Pyricularia sp. CBS 133598]|nr:hypothetical protein PspLS_11144 [Pyricularia sp. CBS 133598]